MTAHRVPPLTFLIAVCAFGLSASCWPMVTLVLPARPTPTQSFATDELGKYLHEITGERVRVWPDHPAWGELVDWQKQSGRFFIIGDTRFSAHLAERCAVAGPEAYCIHSQANTIFLTGASDRGTLHAVYDYLSQLGCRWLVPGREGEVIPKLDSLPQVTLDQLTRPANIRRDLADFNDIEPYLVPWLVRNRINSAAAQSQLSASWGPLIQHYWQRRGGAVMVRFHGHSYAALVPESLFPEHPTWFALIDNERRVRSMDYYWNHEFKTQFCTSNPEVVARVARIVDDWFTAHPEYRSFGLAPEDGGPWCQCEGCRAQDRPPRGHAGRVISLANAVARAIEDRHPDKEIPVLAYADRYLETPDGMEIHPNVRVQVCLWPCPLQPIAGPQTEEGDYYLQHLRTWADTGCRLGVWIYQLYASPTPLDLSVRAMALNARTYRDLGSDDVFHECGGARAWQNLPMATWCWMQLAYDPDRDWRELIRDFCRNYYGAAGEPMARAFLTIEDQLEATGALHKHDAYTPEFARHLHAMLDEALGQADTHTVRQRVQAVKDAVPDPNTYPRQLPPGRWYHLAATWEARDAAGELRLYVDGTETSSKTGAWTPWQPAPTIYIGRRRHAGGTFTGQVDELRLSSAPRHEFDLERPPATDPLTTLLAHYDRPDVLDADFSRGDVAAPNAFPPPYNPAETIPDGRFGGGVNIWQAATMQRFDAIIYNSEDVLDPNAGAIELWMRPGKRARYVAQGTLLDAGPLTLSADGNVVTFSAGGLSVGCDLSTPGD